MGTRIAVVGAGGRVGRHVVDVARERGHDVVPMSRTLGVDVITGAGLDAALAGADVVIDASTTPSADATVAGEWFSTSAANLHAAGARAGVQGMVVVSIIGIDRGFTGGYNTAKLVHERAALAGPVPARILRAAQFHEFVEQLIGWGTQGDVVHLPRMRTQLVAARAVAEHLVDLAGRPFPATGQSTVDGQPEEVAGPREEWLAEAAALLIGHRGLPLRVRVGGNPDDPDTALFEAGKLLPSPHARLAGPTFQEWLAAEPPAYARGGDPQDGSVNS